MQQRERGYVEDETLLEEVELRLELLTCAVQVRETSASKAHVHLMYHVTVPGALQQFL
jgi:hypothetical protein